MKRTLGKSWRSSRFLLLPVACVGVLLCANRDSAPWTFAAIPPERAVVFDTANMATGDVVFRRGRDAMASAVLAQRDASYFSHAGLLCKTGGKAMVAHAFPRRGDGKGVFLEPLADFFSAENALAGAVYRIENFSATEARVAAAYAIERVGRPFDYRLAYSEDSAYYCTELVLKALAAAGQNLVSEIPSTKVFTIKEPVILPEHLRLSRRLRKAMDINF